MNYNESFMTISPCVTSLIHFVLLFSLKICPIIIKNNPDFGNKLSIKLHTFVLLLFRLFKNNKHLLINEIHLPAYYAYN
jgi:hypothetical protein